MSEDKIKVYILINYPRSDVSYQIGLNHTQYILIVKRYCLVYQFPIIYENKVFNILNNEPTKSKKSPLIIFPHLHKI